MKRTQSEIGDREGLISWLLIFGCLILVLVSYQWGQAQAQVQTARVAPVSWRVKKDNGNFGWLILGPAGLPYALDRDEYCLAEVEIEGRVMVVRTDRELCDTRPIKLEIIYKTWEYNSRIEIREVVVPEEN